MPAGWASWPLLVKWQLKRPMYEFKIPCFCIHSQSKIYFFQRHVLPTPFLSKNSQCVLVSNFFHVFLARLAFSLLSRAHVIPSRQRTTTRRRMNVVKFSSNSKFLKFPQHLIKSSSSIIEIALLHISRVQHQYCLSLGLLRISIVWHQNCLSLALLSISIAQHQHCLVLALLSFLASTLTKHQNCISTKLALHQHCISTALALHQHCISTALALSSSVLQHFMTFLSVKQHFRQRRTESIFSLVIK